jgi:hypothetical protein
MQFETPYTKKAKKKVKGKVVGTINPHLGRVLQKISNVG